MSSVFGSETLILLEVNNFKASGFLILFYFFGFFGGGWDEQNKATLHLRMLIRACVSISKEKMLIPSLAVCPPKEQTEVTVCCYLGSKLKSIKSWLPCLLEALQAV